MGKNKAFKNWLRRQMCNTGLSMRQCAEHIGVHPQQMSKWMLGFNLPNMTSFVRLCNVLAELTKQDKEKLYLDGISKIDISKFER